MILRRQLLTRASILFTVTRSAYGLLLAVAVWGCATLNPPPPLRPALPANGCKPPSAAQHNVAGMAHYKERRLEPAKSEFLLAVSDGPKCAEAHYNLGLALWYLEDKEEARKHFLEAANLAPGNQVIWDSPVLHPYSEPQKDTKKKKETAAEKAPGGFGNRGQVGGGY
jgi:tetratricopeptide (TPR) repeat protein